ASGRRNEAIDEYFLRARSAHGNRAMSILLERLGRPRTKKLEMLKRHLAEASLEMGDPSGAEKWLHEAGGVPEGRAELPIHLVSALRAGRFDEARSLARRIVSDEDLRPPPSAPLIYAHLLEGNLLEALRVGRRIHPGEDRPEAFRALGIALLRSRSYVASLIAFGEAERRGGEPGDSLLYLAYKGAIQAHLRGNRLQEASRLLDRALLRYPRSARIRGLRALVLDRRGDPEAALRTMRVALQDARASGGLLREARRLFVERGRPMEAYEVWRKGLPPGIESAPENRLSNRFLDLERWSGEAERFPQDAGIAAALARSYARAGWIREAVAEYRRALRLGAGPDAKRGLRDVHGYRATIQSIREYLADEGEARLRIGDVVERLAMIVGEATGDSPPTDGLIESYMFFGKELNPLVRPRSSLLDYFLRFNHYLDLREAGGKIELRLSELVGWTDEEERIYGVEYRWQRITTDRTTIRYPAKGSHWVAGSASWSRKGFTVDLETIRSTLLPPEEAFSAADGQEVPWRSLQVPTGLRRRLLAGALQRAGSVPALIAAEAENVAQHELGHVVDFAGLIPGGRHPLRHLGILFSHLFRTDAIASRYQAVAETFAISRSADPKLALLTSIEWLRAESNRPDYLLLLYGEEPMGSGIYVRTSRHILGGLVERVTEDRERYPSIDRSQSILSQIDRLDDDAIRRIASMLYVEAGGRR
ncbi:MAG: hypothetical protein O6952_00710, partial [Planctomycetota bacterium]|nr:hypothetical protein [Planctomycetota bacterium]